MVRQKIQRKTISLKLVDNGKGSQGRENFSTEKMINFDKFLLIHRLAPFFVHSSLFFARRPFTLKAFQALQTRSALK